MIGYVTLGTNNMERAAAFYDALLAEIGAKRFMEMDTFIAWATSPDKPGLSVTVPFDGKPASQGNGTMVALAVSSPDMVDAIHARAMSLGATNEGDPGQRMEGFYAGYFRDLDGNKLNAFCLNAKDFEK
ncbi:MAG: VOC family protein [Gammaproteobacteria bacterium]|nr:VOC family protein [Gammaproteobacteria bacterium]